MLTQLADKPNVPTPAVAAVGKPAQKSTEAEKEPKRDAEEETGAKEKKTRSTSRGLVDRLKGKKEEAEAKREEKKVEKEEKKEEDKEDSHATEAATAGVVGAGAVGAGAAAAATSEPGMDPPASFLLNKS